MNFNEMKLTEPLLLAIAEEGYVDPTPIQREAIPEALSGRDVMGMAQTGTGKTCAFAVPILESLSGDSGAGPGPRALVLCPTRELATQIHERFCAYGRNLRLRYVAMYGGVKQGRQVESMRRGADVLVATPGRLLDLVGQGHVDMSGVRFLVLDEADRMLDMGFIPDVEKIVSLMPKIRQTLMFSATMPPVIRRLAEQFLMNPKEITVSPPSSTAETVSQSLVIVDHREKRSALRALLRSEDVRNALIFCNRKRDVSEVQNSLKRHGIEAGSLHGDMDQFQRTDTLEAFKNGDINLLVCSDVAARGLDIEAMSHVFNFDVPINADDYVHRIGRTGRAGRSGRAITLAAPDEKRYLDTIVSLTGVDIPRLELDAIKSTDFEETEYKPRSRRNRATSRTKKTSDSSNKSSNKPDSSKTSKNNKPASLKRNNRMDSVRDNDNERETPIGLGDHVPAFLLKSPK